MANEILLTEATEEELLQEFKERFPSGVWAYFFHGEGAQMATWGNGQDVLRAIALLMTETRRVMTENGISDEVINTTLEQALQEIDASQDGRKVLRQCLKSSL